MFGRRKLDALQAEQALIIIDDTVDPHVVMYHQPRGLLAEQYRALRTNIQALNRENVSRAILLTSSLKGEGKSLTTLNLAAAFAELEHSRICVVDCDWRAPSLHERLTMEPDVGLSELLTDRASLDDVIRPTQVRNLSVILAGEEPENPSDLLGSARVSDLISALKERFNYILFDTPPAATFTDASILAPRVDGVVFVVRLETTPRKVVSECLQRLETVGGVLLGCHLTGARAAQSDLKQYYYSYGS